MPKIDNRIRLTQRLVDGTKPPSTGEILLMDSEVPGLGLRVRAGGSRVWVFRKRGVKRTLGSALDVLLSEAREIAREKPKPVQKTRELTVDEARDRYLIDLEKHRKSPEYIKEARRITDAHLLPTLGKRLLSDVTKADIRELHSSMSDTPRTANLLLSFVSRIWTLADAHPVVRGIERYHEPPRERVLNNRELAAILGALGDSLSAKAIKLLAMTGARPKEVLSCRWVDLDLEAGTWTKPSQHTKIKKEHKVPLHPLAVELLKTIERTESPWVFPSDSKEGHILSVKTTWQAAVARVGLEDVRLYDLRKTFATRVVDQGADIKTTMLLTGHTQATTLLKHYVFSSESKARSSLDKVLG